MARKEDTNGQALIDMKARLAKAEERTDKWMMQASTDSLTALLNRRGFVARTEHLTWGWIVAIDLDGFKRAQDSRGRGHGWGDCVLKEHADFLVGLVREREFRAGMVLIARTGGDEFMIWTETRAGARRMRDHIREWQSEHGPVTASAGIGDTTEAADAAMFCNKTSKRAEAIS